jgi:hypothetical protein
MTVSITLRSDKGMLLTNDEIDDNFINLKAAVEEADAAIAAAKDVLEFANLAAFPVSGADATVYIAADSGLVYRWNGSAYAPVGGGGVQSITGVGGLVVDNTDPQNPILSTTAVLKDNSPLVSYGTNSLGAQAAYSPENVSFSQATSPLKGVVTLYCEASVGRTTKVFVNADVTSWVFNNRPPAGYYYNLDVYIIQDSTPRTCVSPATAGKTAGGAWTISAVAGETQRMILKVTATDVEMYPFPVLS